MELCGSFLAELLHRVDHFLLKFLEGTGFAEVDPLSSSILRQVLKVECPLTVGEELNRRGFPLSRKASQRARNAASSVNSQSIEEA